MNRRFEKLNISNSNWDEIPFEDIKKGDMFRSFEPDGTPVEGGCVFTALTDAENGAIQIAGKERP